MDISTFENSCCAALAGAEHWKPLNFDLLNRLFTQHPKLVLPRKDDGYECTRTCCMRTSFMIKLFFHTAEVNLLIQV